MIIRRFIFSFVVLACSLSVCLGSTGEFITALPTTHDNASFRTLDDPQPDTLLWDNGVLSFLWPGEDYWVRVEFTAPDTFNLRSIYFYTTNYPGAAGPCSVWVHGDNAGELGDVLSVYPQMDLIDRDWNDGNLPTPITFNPGETFYVVLGPIPGGDQQVAWAPMIDGASTGHGALGQDGHYGDYDSNVPGDWMVRCGGLISEYTDLRSTECWNIVNNDVPSFNILPNDLVLLHGTIENIGSEDVSSYTVNWTINGPGGNVYTQQTTGTNLNSGQDVEVVAPSAATLIVPGEYMASCQVTTQDDGVAGNNTTYLRFFVGDAPRWFYYDDNQANTHINPSENTSHGIAFTPPSYPARIESLRVEFGGEGIAPVAIYVNDGENGSPGETPIWSGSPTVVEGWNVIVIDDTVNIFEGQIFTVATGYHEDQVSTGKDDTPPNEAGISHMSGIGWFFDGTGWTEDTGGNWCIQVFMDTSSAIPPYPVLDVSTSSLQFDTVSVGSSAERTFWIWNRGDIDDLEITGMTISPPPLRLIYQFDMVNATIPAGDSVEVTATFTPGTEQNYTAFSILANNSHNDPNFQILLHGVGGDVQSISSESSEVPSEFTLSQNYPNPFNPATHIDFALPVQSAVKLSVFNTLGQQVATLLQGDLEAGFHSVEFEAADLSAGLYFYKLEAGSFTQTRKMMLLK